MKIKENADRPREGLFFLNRIQRCRLIDGLDLVCRIANSFSQKKGA